MDLPTLDVIADHGYLDPLEVRHRGDERAPERVPGLDLRSPTFKDDPKDEPSISTAHVPLDPVRDAAWLGPPTDSLAAR